MKAFKPNFGLILKNFHVIITHEASTKLVPTRRLSQISREPPSSLKKTKKLEHTTTVPKNKQTVVTKEIPTKCRCLNRKQSNLTTKNGGSEDFGGWPYILEPRP